MHVEAPQTWGDATAVHACACVDARAPTRMPHDCWLQILVVGGTNKAGYAGYYKVSSGGQQSSQAAGGTWWWGASVQATPGSSMVDGWVVGRHQRMHAHCAPLPCCSHCCCATDRPDPEQPHVPGVRPSDQVSGGGSRQRGVQLAAARAGQGAGMRMLGRRGPLALGPSHRRPPLCRPPLDDQPGPWARTRTT